MDDRRRVAFPLVAPQGATGIFHYLVNLFRVLHRYGSGSVEPVVFVGTDAGSVERAQLAQPGVRVKESPLFDVRWKRRSLLRSLLMGRDAAVEGLFRKEGIALVFENAAFYGWRLGIPTLAWMPDFQHRRLRRFFGTAAFLRRELGFRAQVASGRMVLVSSRDAQKDCIELYGVPPDRVVAVRFAVLRPDLEVASDPDAIREKYGLPERFFYVPNQFWVHKNHLVVIDALALLKREGRPVAVAASGRPVDPRRPRHYQDLVARVRTLDLSEEFRFLGVIPYSDVSALMCACIGVINPSLFEGWSSSVEEAKSLDVPVVLSDIPVHREQEPLRAIYFDPQNPAMLAKALVEALDRFHGLPHGGSQEADSEARFVTFAREFEEAVSKATVRGTRE